MTCDRNSHRPKRTSERGAALFVVVMAIMLVTGLGVWSMRSAALVDQASGFARAASQGQYLAEFGIIAATAQLSVPNEAWIHDEIARGATPVRDQCAMATAPTGGAPSVLPYCRVFEDTVINQFTTNAIPSATNPGTGRPVLDQTPAGSFGPIEGPVAGESLIEGRFWVEMTDGQSVNVAGSQVGVSGYRRVVLTSFGLLRPRPAAGGTICSAGENASAVQAGVRAHALIGPVAPNVAGGAL
ncbi:MAG: hypothetical protein B6A08_08135 [Sorangiineae bacterium NIC37A_2]|jgi:hypothetical protein|nr:MAG: hypothetical protein B6A08_08135 [Sorangiineae bacterium NIC37A_2]